MDLVVPRFWPSVGGIEESVTQLARGLMARGHEVVVHTARLPETPAAEAWQKIPIRRYVLRKNQGYYASRFEPVLEGDLVHLHAYAHQTNDWVIARHAETVPIVYSTHHGINFPKPRVWQRVYHWWYNWRRGIPSLRKADAVLVPTRVDRDEFKRRGVDAQRLHIVPSGVDAQAFHAHRPWRPAHVKNDFLLFLGRLHREKGVHDLVRAYDLLRPPMDLILAGKNEGAVRKLRPLPPGIHLLNEFTPRQKWGLLEACHALVLPSHYEGQGIVVAEAWAKGKPVVAARAGGLSAVVEHERTGLLVDVGDEDGLVEAMRRIIKDKRLARRLGAAGRKQAQQEYSWPPLLDRVEAIYDAVLKTRR